MGAYWRSDYESDSIITEAYKIYDQILPLYKQLHAYVRRILHKTHGNNVDVKGRIPACLLGRIGLFDPTMNIHIIIHNNSNVHKSHSGGNSFNQIVSLCCCLLTNCTTDHLS